MDREDASLALGAIDTLNIWVNGDAQDVADIALTIGLNDISKFDEEGGQGDSWSCNLSPNADGDAILKALTLLPDSASVANAEGFIDGSGRPVTMFSAGDNCELTLIWKTGMGLAKFLRNWLVRQY